jgi:hypothetical protein
VVRHYPCNCCDNNNFQRQRRLVAGRVGKVARELLKRVAKEDKPLGGAARRFVEFHQGEAELLRAGACASARNDRHHAHEIVGRHIRKFSVGFC